MGDLKEKLETAAVVISLITIGAIGGFAIVGLAKIGIETMSSGVKSVKKVARNYINVGKAVKAE